jgi:uncharacterized protein with von Willebrand factor type A (vWA) domain
MSAVTQIADRYRTANTGNEMDRLATLLSRISLQNDLLNIAQGELDQKQMNAAWCYINEMIEECQTLLKALSAEGGEA